MKNCTIILLTGCFILFENNLKASCALVPRLAHFGQDTIKDRHAALIQLEHLTTKTPTFREKDGSAYQPGSRSLDPSIFDAGISQNPEAPILHNFHVSTAINPGRLRYFAN